ncbi:MAG: DNA adenine methylase [Deferribacteraceae bacterium]|nr:DNA adenine methylase [Deferribacteraceae bacterium]
MLEIVSPLRYPGGKSRAVSKILPHIPPGLKEFREPFVGGGSVFLAVKQTLCSCTHFAISDLNYDLYCFWQEAKTNNAALYCEIRKIKESAESGRSLFARYTQNYNTSSELERAVRFFVLNRITFSGTVDSGGYSEKAFRDRFTFSSIERIRPLQSILADVDIKNLSYEQELSAAGDNLFLFLDPPYFCTAKSRLYGKRGALHTGFNHEKFAEDMKKCNHQWLITLDDSPIIRELFSFAYITEWKLQYGMNNYKQEKAAIGRELFISNYKLKVPKNYNLSISTLLQDMN